VVRFCSDGSGEFGECGRDAPAGSGFDAEFVVSAANVLITRAVWSRLSPRIGRSRALSRPWSASIRLFAYCSVLRARDQLLDHRAERRGPIGHNLDRLTMSTQRPLEEPSRRRGVASR
jgi:hypothetical protein